MLVSCHKHRIRHTLGLKILVLIQLLMYAAGQEPFIHTCCINSFVVSKWVIVLLLYNSFQDHSFTAHQHVWLILASSFIYAINSAVFLYFLTETSKFIGGSQTYDMKILRTLMDFQVIPLVEVYTHGSLVTYP